MVLSIKKLISLLILILFFTNQTLAQDNTSSKTKNNSNNIQTSDGDKNTDVPQVKNEVKKDELNQIELNLQQLQEKLSRLEENYKHIEKAEKAVSQTKTLEIDGYFRLRGDIFQHLDLGLYNFFNNRSTTDNAYLPTPLSGDIGNDENITIGTTNMRLRVEPTINIGDDIKVKTQIDVLDNLVLGSTPDGFPGKSYRVPRIVFSQSQNAPIYGFNSLKDSIMVKRAWVEFMTPVGLIKAGRMGTHWGLGILSNDGNCYDCDYGDTVDRLMFITKIKGHYIVPAIDYVATGPTNAVKEKVSTRDNTSYKDYMSGQPKDLDQRDDAIEYILAIAKKLKESEVKKRLADGKAAIDYGVYFVLRKQATDLPALYWGSVDNSELYINSYSIKPEDYIRRDVSLYIPDIWFKILIDKWRIEAEAAAIIGKIGDNRQTLEEDIKPVDINMYGGVLQFDYKTMFDRLTLGGEFGIASADSSDQGFGVEPMRYPQDSDGKITVFAFDRDYIVDMLLYREILGAVAASWYAKAKLDFQMVKGFGINLGAIYSQALAKIDTYTGKLPLGLELDGDLYYKTEGGFEAGIAMGYLFALSGLDYMDRGMVYDAKNAFTLQGRLLIKF